MDDVALLLANSAQQGPDGLISALGIGWSVTSSPTAPSALLLFVKVPWDQTNVKHRAVLDLLDADGAPALVDGGPVQVTMEFETGRPPGVPRGTPIDWAQALSFVPIDLAPGRYEWRLTIDGEPGAARPFTVRG